MGGRRAPKKATPPTPAAALSCATRVHDVLVQRTHHRVVPSARPGGARETLGGNGSAMRRLPRVVVVVVVAIRDSFGGVCL